MARHTWVDLVALPPGARIAFSNAEAVGYIGINHGTFDVTASPEKIFRGDFSRVADFRLGCSAGVNKFCPLGMIWQQVVHLA